MCNSTGEAQMLAGCCALHLEKTTWLMLLNCLEVIMSHVSGFLLLWVNWRLSPPCSSVHPLPCVYHTLLCLPCFAASQEQLTHARSMDTISREIRRMDRLTLCTLLYLNTTFMLCCSFLGFQITKLKIDSNPFAKGFRDSSRLTDIER